MRIAQEVMKRMKKKIIDVMTAETIDLTRQLKKNCPYVGLKDKIYWNKPKEISPDRIEQEIWTTKKWGILVAEYGRPAVGESKRYPLHLRPEAPYISRRKVKVYGKEVTIGELPSPMALHKWMAERVVIRYGPFKAVTGTHFIRNTVREWKQAFIDKIRQLQQSVIKEVSK